MAEQDQAIHV